jgi:Xaa-Pro aminopeptidase
MRWKISGERMNPDVKLHAARRDRLRGILRREGLAALLVSQSANRYYLSGFELHNPQENESAGMLLVTSRGSDILFTDPRYRDVALRLWPEAALRIYRGNAPLVVAETVSAQGAGALGLEAQGISLEFFDECAASLSALVEIRRTRGLVEELRRVKSPDEQERIRAACALNHAMMDWLPSVALPGRAEARVAWDIEKFFREHGASEPAFATIVGRGENAALPHCIPGEDLLRRDDLVLVDAGCRVRDYCSDQTRTLWLGSQPSARFRDALQAVREAQNLAIALIRPGIPCREVFQAAWDCFARLGVADSFTHGLGHGVGLETHEGPSLNHVNALPLEPGMVVTVEPGLYDPAWGGVRWEHMVVVTEDGNQVL